MTKVDVRGFPRVHIVLSRARLSVRGRGTNVHPIAFRPYEYPRIGRKTRQWISRLIHAVSCVRAQTFLSFTPGTDTYTRDRPIGLDRNDFRHGLPRDTT